MTDNEDDTSDREDPADVYSTDPREPDILSSSLIARVNTLDEDELRALSTYALSLANTESYNPDTIEIEDPQNPTDAEIEAFLIQKHGKAEGGAPEKAHYTTKNINGYNYFYWQWRDTESGKIKSKYVCPVKETPFDGATFGETPDTETTGSESTDTDDESTENDSTGEKQNNTSSCN